MLHWPVRYKQYKRSARHAPPTPHINSNTRKRTLLAKETRLRERVYIGSIRLRDSTAYRHMKFHEHPVSVWPPRQKSYLQWTDREPNTRRGLHQGTINVKVKVTFRGGVEVQLYSFFNFGANGVVHQRHAQVALPPGKTRYPLYRRLSGPQGRGGQVRKISPPPHWASIPWIVQPVASSYTDWAIQATIIIIINTVTLSLRRLKPKSCFIYHHL